MAFTMNLDDARQEQARGSVKNSWNKELYAICSLLTETSVRASDRRAVFVGVDAYEAAGGIVLRGLVQGDDSGWPEDPALLDWLVAEKLLTEAEALASDGWKCIEVATALPYGYSGGLRLLAGDLAPITDEESAAHATLLAEYRTLEDEYSGYDEYPEETAVQEGDGADAMGQGDDVGVSSWEPAATSAGGTGITSGGQRIGIDLSEEDDNEALKPLPERLVMELTAHHTLALHEAIGRSPDVALALLLLKLLTKIFCTPSALTNIIQAPLRQA